MFLWLTACGAPDGAPTALSLGSAELATAPDVEISVTDPQCTDPQGELKTSLADTDSTSCGVMERRTVVNGPSGSLVELQGQRLVWINEHGDAQILVAGSWLPTGLIRITAHELWVTGEEQWWRVTLPERYR